MKAIFRAHNTVNRRLDKPVYPTVAECLAVYKNNIQSRSSRDYRHAQLRHIRNDWSKMRDMNGFTAMRKISELIRIENEQWGPRDQGLIPDLADDAVPPLPRPNGESGEPRPVTLLPRSSVPVRFVGGRFRFGK